MTKPGRSASPRVNRVNGPRRQRSFLRGLVKASLLLLLLGIVWVTYAWMQMESGKNTKPVRQADVGIVLGASLWNDWPSPGLQERLNLAIREYKSGRFPYLIVTGGKDVPSAQRTEAEGMALYLEQHGIPKDKIILENEATSTYENLKFSRKIMQDHAFKTAVIMTHQYHGRRAMEIARTLHYNSPQISLTESKVLKMEYHKVREILAYTKWKLKQAEILLIGS